MELVAAAQPLWESSMEELVMVQPAGAMLSVWDLREDHERVCALLHRFEHATTVPRRSEAMRLALDLFEVHSALEDQLYSIGGTQRAMRVLNDLRQLVELTDPASGLYVERGLQLKRVMEAHMTAEEDVDPLMVRHQIAPLPHNRDLLLVRWMLIEQAQDLLRVH
jgi:hypothetical protein